MTAISVRPPISARSNRVGLTPYHWLPSTTSTPSWWFSPYYIPLCLAQEHERGAGHTIMAALIVPLWALSCHRHTECWHFKGKGTAHSIRSQLHRESERKYQTVSARYSRVQTSSYIGNQVLAPSKGELSSAPHMGYETTNRPVGDYVRCTPRPLLQVATVGTRPRLATCEPWYRPYQARILACLMHLECG